MGAARDTVRFRLGGVIHEVRNPYLTQTVLRWLRAHGPALHAVGG